MSMVINILVGLVGLVLILLAVVTVADIVIAVSWLIGKGVCKVFGDSIRDYTDYMGRKEKYTHATIGFIYTSIVCSSVLLLYLFGSSIVGELGL